MCDQILPSFINNNEAIADQQVFDYNLYIYIYICFCMCVCVWS